MTSGKKMLREQNELLKGLGVDPGNVSITNDDNEECSASELRMSQRMVNDVAAPGCKGLSGSALVDCVDAALEDDQDQ